MQVTQSAMKVEVDLNDSLMVSGDSFDTAAQKNMRKTFKLEENQSDSDDTDSFDVMETSGMSANLIRNCNNIYLDSARTPTHIDKTHVKKEKVSSKNKSEWHEDIDKEDSDVESVTLTQSRGSSLQMGVFKTPRRSKAPDGFVQSSVSLPSYSKDPKKELWLLQVPAGFNVKCLDNTLRMSLLEGGGIQKVKMKTEETKQAYSVHICRNSGSQKKLSTVATNSNSKIVLGDVVPHSMIVTERLHVPHGAATVDLQQPAVSQVPVHTDLKIRFTSFGAGKPKGTLASTILQKVRKRKKKHDDDDDTHPKPKKPKVEPAEGQKDDVDFVHPRAKKVKAEPIEIGDDDVDFVHPRAKKVKVEPVEIGDDDVDFVHPRKKKVKVEPVESGDDDVEFVHPRKKKVKVEPVESGDDDVEFVHPRAKKVKVEPVESGDDDVEFVHPRKKVKVEPVESGDDDVEFVHSRAKKVKVEPFESGDDDVEFVHPRTKKVKVEPVEIRDDVEFVHPRAKVKVEPAESGEAMLPYSDISEIHASQSRKHKKSKRHRVDAETSAAENGDSVVVTDSDNAQPSRKHKKSKRHRVESEMPSAVVQDSFFIVDRSGENFVAEPSDSPVKHKKKKKIKVEEQ